MNVILDRTHPGGFRGYILRFQDGEDGHESHIPCLLFLSSNKCSSTNWNRIHKLKNLTQTIMYSLHSKRIFFPTNVVGTSVIEKQRMRKKIYQESSTSGRGARASNRKMFTEISARWSLLEPRFRYLSPGREGGRERNVGPWPYVTDPFYPLS